MASVFLGTSEFAVGVLRRLAGSRWRPALVITRPDRPRGRGRRLASPPVATAARELSIEVLQPADVGDEQVLVAVEAVRPEAICVCAFGALIKEPLLSFQRILNVHPSLLPRWRGAAPIERAIMAGDARTGVSVMVVTAGLDSGPVCAQTVCPIEPEDTYGTLAPRLQSAGAELLLATLEADPPCRPQDDSRASYAEKIAPEDRKLDGRRSASELERVVRALEPHVGAYVELPDGGRLGVGRARVGGDGDVPPGTLWFQGGLPRLACAAGSLELLVVRPAGRREMSGEEYVRGHRG